MVGICLSLWQTGRFSSSVLCYWAGRWKPWSRHSWSSCGNLLLLSVTVGK